MGSISKKICLLGDFAVGKTSLIRRFVYNRFDDKYISTIGVKVSRKTVSVSTAATPKELTMLIWDLAGSNAFDQVQASYMRGAAGAILVCDLTRAQTLDSVQTYAGNLLTVSPEAKLILAANKKDLANQHEFSINQIEKVTTPLAIPFYLTSAKTGDEVETVFRHLGKLLLFN